MKFNKMDAEYHRSGHLAAFYDCVTLMRRYHTIERVSRFVDTCRCKNSLLIYDYYLLHLSGALINFLARSPACLREYFLGLKHCKASSPTLDMDFLYSVQAGGICFARPMAHIDKQSILICETLTGEFAKPRAPKIYRIPDH